MNMKRLLCLAMALMLALSLAACSAKSSEPAATEAPAVTEAPAEEATEAPAEEPAEEATEEPAEEATEAPAEEPVEETAEEPAEETAEASADEGSLEDQLAAAKLRIADLEALVEKYQPVYESQVVATYGTDGVIWKDDATAQYNSVASMYQQYGISVDSYAAQIKQSVLETMVQDAVLDAKAQELGLKDLSEETLADLQTQAQDSFDNYVNQYKSYFATDSAGNELTDEEAVAQTTAYLNQNGLTVDSLLTRVTDNYISEQLHSSVTGDVTVSDEEIQAKYDSMVAADQEKYADDYSYNSARSQGTAITWNPEGYRAVKHVLIKFDSDQAAQYNTLKNTIDSLNTELESLEQAAADAEAETEPADATGTEAPEAEPAEAAEAETAETEPAETEPAEAAETEAAEATEAEAIEPAETESVETAEAIEAAEPRTREQIQTELGQAGAEMEALYSTLLPKAQEVIDAFNAGTDFDALMEKYGEDPGMTTEPNKTQGYAVSEGSTYWESAFTEGAMSIAEVGQISEPVRGSNGIHIIYYMSDITPGAVPFEDVSEEVAKQALSDKVTETYNNQVTAWIEEAAPTYFVERF